MPIEITLITGRANTGKSTLVRCLTGKARGSNLHPSAVNMANLAWLTQSNIEPTVVIGSSLNEGPLLPWISPWDESSKTRQSATNPNDINVILDAYEAKFAATKAIISISTKVTKANWALADYLRHLQSGSHHVAHIVDLGGQLAAVGGITPIGLPAAPHPSNLVAAACRPQISLL